MSSSTAISSAALLEALEPMAQLVPGPLNPFGAVGYGIGRRQCEGRVTRERAMLVFVPRKSRNPGERLPRRVPGTRVPIDVVPLGASWLPGDEPALPEEPEEVAAASPLGLRAGRWLCAAGFGVPFEAPELLLTVRHPFAAAEPGTPVFSFRQRIGALATDGVFGGVDLALIRLSNGLELGSSLPSGERLSGSGAAQFFQLGSAVCFYSPVRGALVRPRVLAIRVTAFLLPWGDGASVRQERLVMTEGVTSPGDSGAPLFDAAGTVIGVASFRTDQFSFFEGVGHGRIEQLMQEVA